MSRYYVSVTGLQLKSFWHFPKFTKYTIPARRQAKTAPGNIYSDATYVKGVFHTLTVWEDRKSMVKYMLSGAHAKAMTIVAEVGQKNKVYSYESDSIPTWSEALELWDKHGRVHGLVAPSKGAVGVSPPSTDEQKQVSSSKGAFPSVTAFGVNTALLVLLVSLQLSGRP